LRYSLSPLTRTNYSIYQHGKDVLEKKGLLYFLVSILISYQNCFNCNFHAWSFIKFRVCPFHFKRFEIMFPFVCKLCNVNFSQLFSTVCRIFNPHHFNFYSWCIESTWIKFYLLCDIFISSFFRECYLALYLFKIFLILFENLIYIYIYIIQIQFYWIYFPMQWLF